MRLEDILSHFENVTQRGKGWMVRCPAHADDTASLSLDVGDGGRLLAYCHAGCKFTDVIEAAGLPKGVSVEGTDATVTRQVTTGAPDTAEIARLAAFLDQAHRDLIEGTHPRASEAMEYLRARFGLGHDDARRLGLGVMEDRSGPRVVVPLRDAAGRRRGWQARALGSGEPRWTGPHKPSQGRWAAVGMLEGRGGWSEVMVTEGPSDALTAVSAGYDAIAITGASRASSPDVVDEVLAMLDGRVAVLAGDADPAGRAFNATLTDSLTSQGAHVKVLTVPPDAGDLNGWRSTAGADWPRILTDTVASLDETTATSAAMRVRDYLDYPASDDGQARWVLATLAGTNQAIRYAPGQGWLTLDRGVWRAASEWRIRGEIQRVARDDHRVAASRLTGKEDPPELRAAAKWSLASQSTSRVDAALKAMPGLQEVFVDDPNLDGHPDYLATLNGVVDLRTGELLGHRPDLLLTKRVNLEYRPDATAPRWESFLEEVLGAHPGLVEYIQTLTGYGITGRTVEQILAVFYGRGANGKSTYTDTIGRVFSEFTAYPAMSSFTGHREAGAASDDLASLRGARLALTNEGDDGVRLSEAIIKELTGGTEITARHLHQRQFTFRPEFLILIATNHKPALQGVDEALWRRIHLVPWTTYVPPEKRDPYLAERLYEQEAEGILAWAVRGAVRWYAERLKIPPVVQNATAEYRKESDPLAGFIGEVIELAPGQAPLREIYDRYLAWCDDENIAPRLRLGKQKLRQALEERGATRAGDRTKGPVLAGVRVR